MDVSLAKNSNFESTLASNDVPVVLEQYNGVWLSGARPSFENLK
jgi:hypothetical protein